MGREFPPNTPPDIIWNDGFEEGRRESSVAETVNKTDLAKFIWKARQEIHGRYPDDGLLEKQPPEIQDWVTREAEEILRFIFGVEHFGGPARGDTDPPALRCS